MVVDVRTHPRGESAREEAPAVLHDEVPSPSARVRTPESFSQMKSAAVLVGAQTSVLKGLPSARGSFTAA
jgi:hypothetical protein